MYIIYTFYANSVGLNVANWEEGGCILTWREVFGCNNGRISMICYAKQEN